jgi:hypothetical protein
VSDLDDQEQRVVDIVTKHGWMVQCIAPAEGEIEEWFAYTTGLLTNFGWPELICFGLEVKTMQGLLNNAVNECQEQGIRPKAGTILKSVAKGINMKLVAVDEWQWAYTGWSQWFAEYSGIPLNRFDCLQMLWPDKTGLFPDEPNCHLEVIRLQTPLEQPE